MPDRMSDKKIKDKERKTGVKKENFVSVFLLVFESVIWYVIMQKADE